MGLRPSRRAIEQLVNDGHLKKTTRRGVGDAYVTERTLQSEREVLKRVADGMDASEPLADAAQVNEALAGSRLTAGQKQAVETILLGRHRTVGVQGYAGTGKTSMLKEALAHCGSRRVIGLAPSATAAATLSREAGIAARTLQWFLTRYHDVADGVIEAGALEELKERFAGAVVVVDEMSMVSTAQAKALLRIADRLGVGRLVLVGDRKQLRSIGAGQPFRLLQDAGMPTAHMDDILRQRNERLKAAVHDAVAGDPGARPSTAGGQADRGADGRVRRDGGADLAEPAGRGAGRHPRFSRPRGNCARRSTRRSARDCATRGP